MCPKLPRALMLQLSAGIRRTVGRHWAHPDPMRYRAGSVSGRKVLRAD